MTELSEQAVLDAMWPSTLERFAARYEDSRGVDLRQLDPGSVLHIQTQHSHYRLSVINGPKGIVRIQGGMLFADEATVRVDGSTAGGSVLAAHCIVVGFCMEFSAGRQRIVTSRITSVELQEPGEEELEAEAS